MVTLNVVVDCGGTIQSSNPGHPSGTVSLERHLIHCFKTRRPYRKHFPAGLPPSERHSAISSLKSTQYASDTTEGSQLWFVEFSVTFSVVPSSVNRTSIRRRFVINAVFQRTTVGHSHSSGQNELLQWYLNEDDVGSLGPAVIHEYTGPP